MIFRENTYSVLMVTASREFGSRLSALLPASEYWPAVSAGSGGETRRRLLDASFDIVLINSPLPDESGIRLAEDIEQGGDTGILLFVKNDLYDEIYTKVCEKGIMVLPKPTSGQLVEQAVRLLCTVKERLRSAQDRQATVEDKIREIRIVNRAKWLLIERDKMTEKEAHYCIERNAMNARISRKEAAERIIAKYSD